MQLASPRNGPRGVERSAAINKLRCFDSAIERFKKKRKHERKVEKRNVDKCSCVCVCVYAIDSSIRPNASGQDTCGEWVSGLGCLLVLSFCFFSFFFFVNIIVKSITNYDRRRHSRKVPWAKGMQGVRKYCNLTKKKTEEKRHLFSLHTNHTFSTIHTL